MKSGIQMNIGSSLISVLSMQLKIKDQARSSQYPIEQLKHEQMARESKLQSDLRQKQEELAMLLPDLLSFR
jgi:hypothetical protein